MKTKLTEAQKQANKEAKKAKKTAIKEAEKIQAEQNQPEIKDITITIEWKKSRMWGNNPHATASINYKDKTAGAFRTGFYRSPEGRYTCSGCGYDKESTVIAQIFNEFLKYKLYKPLKPHHDKNNIPYGIYIGHNKYYGGGIGVNCYYHISEAIGGKFECVASGKTFDVYKYTDNE
jgi:transposase-like protein